MASLLRPARVGAHFPTLDRRGFLLQSFRFGAVATAGGSTLLACDGGVEPDGSYEAPWTTDNPGPDPAGDFPQLYAAYVDDTNVRLWTEAIDPATGDNHEMTAAHYIKALALRDEFGNDIAVQGFRYDNDARLVTTVPIPPEVTRIEALAECNNTGWWMTSWDVATAVKLDPAGDTRRPLTAAKPGEWGDKIDVHLPVFGTRPDGQHSIEIGDRAGGYLHEMTPEHYIKSILVFDEYHQPRVRASISPNYQVEPVIDFPPIGGTSYVRIVVECNLHDWWEAVYTLPSST